MRLQNSMASGSWKSTAKHTACLLSTVFCSTMNPSAAVRTLLPVKSHWLPEESQKVFRIIWNLETWTLCVTGVMQKIMWSACGWLCSMKHRKISSSQPASSIPYVISPKKHSLQTALPSAGKAPVWKKKATMQKPAKCWYVSIRNGSVRPTLITSGAIRPRPKPFLDGIRRKQRMLN